MDRLARTTTRRRMGGVRAGSVALFSVFLLSGPAFVACSDTHPTTADASPMAAMPTMGAADPAAVVADAVWHARPAYVRANARTEEAYAYAFEHPEIVEWMPCYCGCEAMGHGSNLDCYFRHGQVGKPVFEEHASFCDICVDITLTAKALHAQGQSLAQIRQAIDDAYAGSGAPGTDTAQPPV